MTPTDADPKSGGGGSMCVKYTLLLFNVVYLLGGVAMITVGTIAYVLAGNYPFGGLSVVRPAAVLVLSVGAAVCLLAAYGCARAQLGQHSVPIAYLTVVLLLFLAKIAGVVTGFAQIDQITANVNQEMRSAILLFDKNDPTNAASISWNQMQTKFMCCGMGRGPDDWKHNAALNGSLPDSCCTFPSDCCGCKILKNVSNNYYNRYPTYSMQLEYKDPDNVNKQGCEWDSFWSLRKYLAVLGVVSAAVAGLQVVLVLLAIFMACCVYNCRKMKLPCYSTNAYGGVAVPKSSELAADSLKEQLLSNTD